MKPHRGSRDPLQLNGYKCPPVRFDIYCSGCGLLGASNQFPCLEYIPLKDIQHLELELHSVSAVRAIRWTTQTRAGNRLHYDTSVNFIVNKVIL